MAVSDDIREAIASLKKITDTIDKIDAVGRDIRLMLGVTKFTDVKLRVSIDQVVIGLDSAAAGLSASMRATMNEITRVQGGP